MHRDGLGPGDKVLRPNAARAFTSNDNSLCKKGMDCFTTMYAPKPTVASGFASRSMTLLKEATSEAWYCDPGQPLDNSAFEKSKEVPEVLKQIPGLDYAAHHMSTWCAMCDSQPRKQTRSGEYGTYDEHETYGDQYDNRSVKVKTQ